MPDQKNVDPSLVFPWFSVEKEPATEQDYFRNDFPIDEALVTPAQTTDDNETPKA